MTAAIDVIVTLRRKSVGKRVCNVLWAVSAGKCRRVTAAIDVIVTLCRKSVGKRVCNVVWAVSAVTLRQVFVSRW